MASEVVEAITRVMGRRHNVYDLSIGKGQWVGVNADRNGLPHLFAELNYREGVEVGTQRGHYAGKLCAANPDLHLTCVDPYEGIGRRGKRLQESNRIRAQKNLQSFKCTMLRQTSMDAVRTFADASLDFVYIDGNHTFDFVAPDIIFWSYKVKTNGIIACHDYCQWWEVGVMQAVDAYLFCHGIMPAYVTVEQFPTAFWVKP